MLENKQDLHGILIGTAENKEKAEKISAFFAKCPYCAFSTSKDNIVFTVLTVPLEHKWWLESIKEQPKGTVGLEKAELFFAQYTKVTSPWNTDQVKPELDKSPCGAACPTCPVYKKECSGCPATIYHAK